MADPIKVRSPRKSQTPKKLVRRIPDDEDSGDLILDAVYGNLLLRDDGQNLSQALSNGEDSGISAISASVLRTRASGRLKTGTASNPMDASENSNSSDASTKSVGKTKGARAPRRKVKVSEEKDTMTDVNALKIPKKSSGPKTVTVRKPRGSRKTPVKLADCNAIESPAGKSTRKFNTPMKVQTATGKTPCKNVGTVKTPCKTMTTPRRVTNDTTKTPCKAVSLCDMETADESGEASWTMGRTHSTPELTAARTMLAMTEQLSAELDELNKCSRDLSTPLHNSVMERGIKSYSALNTPMKTPLKRTPRRFVTPRRVGRSPRVSLSCQRVKIPTAVSSSNDVSDSLVTPNKFDLFKSPVQVQRADLPAKHRSTGISRTQELRKPIRTPGATSTEVTSSPLQPSSGIKNKSPAVMSATKKR